MPFAQDGAQRAFTADTDLRTSQWCAVRRTATGIALAGAASVDFLGILQDDPDIGEAGTVKVRDVSKAKAGAAIAAGARLTTDATGRLITAAATNPIVGRALEAAAAADDLFAAEINPGGVA